MNPTSRSQRSPWLFIPTLYFMQGLPVIVVQQLSTAMYEKLGVPILANTVWTSLIAWPWVVKMFWGPVVDFNSTKRNWIVVTQAIITAMLGLLVFGLHLPNFFAFTLAALLAIAFLSATHDIAADGYYLLALDKEKQAFFVGIRSTAFRLATWFVMGLLVIIAGMLEKKHSETFAWTIALGVGAGSYGLFFLYNLWALPRPVADVNRQAIRPLRLILDLGQVFVMIVGVAVFLRLFWHALGAVITMVRHQPWSTFEDRFGSAIYGVARLPYAGQLAAAVAVVALALLSTRILFKRTGMAPAMATFFTQRKIVPILLFIFLYRFSEVMVAKMAPLFLLTEEAKGGMAISTTTFGLINGVVGVGALLVGGIVGGFVVAKWGLKKTLWPLALCMHLPILMYVWAAFARPEVWALAGVVTVDMLSYGFGLAAYLVFMMQVSQTTKDYQTSHYAIATGLMALGAMAAGIACGYLQQALGFAHFFVAASILTIPGTLVLLFIPMYDNTPDDEAPKDTLEEAAATES